MMGKPKSSEKPELCLSTFIPESAPFKTWGQTQGQVLDWYWGYDSQENQYYSCLYDEPRLIKYRFEDRLVKNVYPKSCVHNVQLLNPAHTGLGTREQGIASAMFVWQKNFLNHIFQNQLIDDKEQWEMFQHSNE